MTGPFNQEFVNQGLSYTLSSLSANVADEFSLASFEIPLTGSTIVAAAAAVTTCSASADYTDSAPPTCSGGVCVAMSRGGGSFTPDGTCDSLLGQREADHGMRKS